MAVEMITKRIPSGPLVDDTTQSRTMKNDRESEKVSDHWLDSHGVDEAARRRECNELYQVSVFKNSFFNGIFKLGRLLGCFTTRSVDISQ